MSSINTNVESLLARRVLGQQNQSLTRSLERLSTGLAINRGADNPAGLIASEALRSEKVSLTAAIGNAVRADQVVNVAEGGLQEVNALLLDIKARPTTLSRFPRAWDKNNPVPSCCFPVAVSAVDPVSILGMISLLLGDSSFSKLVSSSSVLCFSVLFS